MEVRPRVRPRALALGAITLAELLDLVAALEGSLGGELVVVVAAASGDSDGDFLPLRGLKLAAPQGIPLLLIGLDQVHRLLVRPWQGLRLLEGGGGGGRGAGHCTWKG